MRTSESAPSPTLTEYTCSECTQERGAWAIERVLPSGSLK
jgi:hypothetical protein